ncbi:MAG TPA: hypothetical protein VMY98_00955 [Anaerolineae bacterium]|nr:hypothetical protein [Anaerolineae bacterium]
MRLRAGLALRGIIMDTLQQRVNDQGPGSIEGGRGSALPGALSGCLPTGQGSEFPWGHEIISTNKKQEEDPSAVLDSSL